MDTYITKITNNDNIPEDVKKYIIEDIDAFYESRSVYASSKERLFRILQNYNINIRDIVSDWDVKI